MATVERDPLEARREELAELVNEQEALKIEYADKRFDDVTRARFNELEAQIEEADGFIKEKEKVNKIISRHVENGDGLERVEFHSPRPGATRGGDIYDLSTVQRSWDNPDAEKAELRDRAMRAIERAKFPNPHVDQEDAQGHLERMAEGIYGDKDGSVARLILSTGSDAYKRAFAKRITQGPSAMLNTEEQGLIERAMSLSGASGGVAVPFVLDPTLLPSYNGAVNPWRNIARVIPIAVDEWRGVTSGGITAAYQAEAAATTDLSPTLASVSISTEMARVTVPYSIEIGMDWGSFASDMAQEIQNSKDVLEATKFATGTGTNEPFGVVTGATTLFTSSDSAALFVADFSGAHDALPPLYRSRAVWALNNSTLTRIRQLDTAGGSNMLTPNIQLRAAANVGGPGGPDMQDSRANVDLYGKAVHEASGVATFADNALIAVFGAFDPYYTIVERVGLSIENVPHMFDATTGFPTGQRALFAFWRNGAKVIAANAFRTLRVA